MSTFISHLPHLIRPRPSLTRFFRRRQTRVVLALVLVAIALFFGGGAPSDRLTPSSTAPTASAPFTDAGHLQGSTTPPPPPEPPVGPYQPNTAGQIMVVAYHAFGAEEGRWERTPAGLRADLQGLYDRGYRPVNLIDMVTGKMDVPKGYSPVVITFDDGREGQFRYITGEDGQQSVDPTSAVGVMLAFNKEHPDWKLRATFYVSDVPFQKADWPAKV